MAAVQDKKTLRGLMRARRKAMPAACKSAADASISAELVRRLGSADAGGPVAVYLALPEEIDLSAFILEMLGRGVAVVSPRWNGATYELSRIVGLESENLRRGPMNVLESAVAEIVPPRRVSAWIVPGLAFTIGGKRLGYGGGWYDRLLADAAPDALKLGVAYRCQIVDELPVESHDILLDGIVTEEV